jgi:predicted Zn finger-like uncharacterized protein
MIVECEKCHTKFNLDENLIKKTGSKFRCSICKHVFILFPPKTEPEIEEVSMGKLEEPGAVPSEEMPKKEEMLVDFDKTLVGEKLEFEEPGAVPSEEMLADFDKTLAEGFEEEAGQEGEIIIQDEEGAVQEEEEIEPISFEDLSHLDSGIIRRMEEESVDVDVDRAMDRATMVEEEITAQREVEMYEEVKEAEEPVKPRPVIKKRRRAGPWLTVLLIILLLAAAGGALIVFKPGLLPESFPLFKKPLSKEQAFDMGNRRLSFKDSNGSFVDSDKAGKLFVVKGFVANRYPDKRSFIRIRSNLLDSKGTVVKSKTVYAGNPISDKELLSLPIEEIDKRVRDKFGKNKMNINVLPNSFIPFMVIFGNLPEDLSEFTVEAVSSSPAGK